jgi:hypothetical protein
VESGEFSDINSLMDISLRETIEA